jgi:hypothetical protein
MRFSTSAAPNWCTISLFESALENVAFNARHATWRLLIAPCCRVRWQPHHSEKKSQREPIIMPNADVWSMTRQQRERPLGRDGLVAAGAPAVEKEPYCPAARACRQGAELVNGTSVVAPKDHCALPCPSDESHKTYSGLFR